MHTYTRQHIDQINIHILTHNYIQIYLYITNMEAILTWTDT